MTSKSRGCNVVFSSVRYLPVRTRNAVNGASTVAIAIAAAR
jgi:hypothetical protein